MGERAHERLFEDYFSKNPTHDSVKFHRRFRVRRKLFLLIVQKVCAYDGWFVQKRDVMGRLGLSSLQKCTATICIFACGIPANATDEYCCIRESPTIEAMKMFIMAVCACFESTFLRQPSLADYQKQMEINAARGFPGMFASLDCIHWEWKNCPSHGKAISKIKMG